MKNEVRLKISGNICYDRSMLMKASVYKVFINVVMKLDLKNKLYDNLPDYFSNLLKVVNNIKNIGIRDNFNIDYLVSENEIYSTYQLLSAFIDFLDYQTGSTFIVCMKDFLLNVIAYSGINNPGKVFSINYNLLEYKEPMLNPGLEYSVIERYK